ncbi:hypothetical protein TWF106_004397 [Orbilia oligospora]|uniref:Uncharacterized protein n=1 Tax=Orbilia oligospora TaxID=2813651 RepID=A0A6G1MIP0_ORBOL|nr:hypothetical protein TWF679_008403 [Orbilia oligospora]KAF3224196.1 hypothetical protein TWF106_004397 [Orbilia oligospora]KAF3230417.1 hypothetical protein TWF191_010302 [Orbilia oligospora]KAF3260467.1 hypothetical protein TWF192_009748 [Orbilia oligospora]
MRQDASSKHAHWTGLASSTEQENTLFLGSLKTPLALKSGFQCPHHSVPIIMQNFELEVLGGTENQSAIFAPVGGTLTNLFYIAFQENAAKG